MLDAISRQNLKAVTRRAHPIIGRLPRALRADRFNEIVFQNLVHEIVRRHQFDYLPFAIKSAANYSLLYILYRVIQETGIQDVLELGVGESTLFLDRLKRLRQFSLTSYEQDADWRATVGARVGHAINLSPLQARAVMGETVQGYDFSGLGEKKFDFVVIDGPVGTARKSRWGALELLERNLADEFVIVFDDAERKAEQDTARRALEFFFDNGKDVFVNSVLASKAQIILTSRKYRNLQFI